MYKKNFIVIIILPLPQSLIPRKVKLSLCDKSQLSMRIRTMY